MTFTINKKALAIVGCVFALIGAAALVGCATGGGEEPLTQTQIIDRASESTVRIITKDSFGVGGGTGIVIDAQKGLVLTNEHVVSGATSIKAVYRGAERTAARVIAHAPCEDLAMLKLSLPIAGTKSIEFASSSALVRGQHLTVVGFPGVINGKQSRKLVPTEGNVSVPNQSASPGDDYPQLPSVVLHQATINHGNSGGPLVNDKAQLVGVNTLVNPDANNQYYSISSDRVKSLLAGLKAGKSRDYIGWDLLPTSQISDETVNELYKKGIDVWKKALFVTQVESGSPADKIKAMFGDNIYQLGGQDVKSIKDVCDVMQSHGKGDTVKVTALNTAYPNGWTDKFKLR